MRIAEDNILPYVPIVRRSATDPPRMRVGLARHCDSHPRPKSFPFQINHLPPHPTPKPSPAMPYSGRMTPRTINPTTPASPATPLRLRPASGPLFAAKNEKFAERTCQLSKNKRLAHQHRTPNRLKTSLRKHQFATIRQEKCAFCTGNPL